MIRVFKLGAVKLGKSRERSMESLRGVANDRPVEWVRAEGSPDLHSETVRASCQPLCSSGFTKASRFVALSFLPDVSCRLEVLTVVTQSQLFEYKRIALTQ